MISFAKPVVGFSILVLSTLGIGIAPHTPAAGVPAIASPARTQPRSRAAKQFTGRDIYSADVHPNPAGAGYLMWYSGWQTQRTYSSGQYDTIYRRTAPTAHGPWSNPTTDLISSQVAPQISEVGDPSVSIVPARGGYRYTMFFTALACHLSPGCSTAGEFAAHAQIWSATSSNGNNWGSFRQLAIADPGHLGVSTPSVVLRPEGAQQWLVYYASGCRIGLARVGTTRQVMASSTVYSGTGTRCMSNPDVFRSGAEWEMLFDVLEPTPTDPTRFDIWKASSPSATNWSASTSTPVVVVKGHHHCSALAPDALPLAGGRIALYYGMVTPDASGRCADLTRSTSIMMSPGSLGTRSAASPSPGPSPGAARSRVPRAGA
ncbi:MAG: hypothetical protein ACYCV7_04015 [Acidimicrobiales bacterium]